MRAAVEADVQVYTIIVDGLTDTANGGSLFRPALIEKSWDHGDQRKGRSLMEDLADRTGGLHVRVQSEAEAKAAAIKIGRALRNEYVLGYRPPESAAAGRWHRIRVRLDLPKLNIHSRTGYYSR